MFKVLDEADGKQIISEEKGAYEQALVYLVDGKPTLSYLGVRYAARMRGGLHVKHVKCFYNQNLDQYEATVIVRDESSNTSLQGSAEEPRTVGGEVDVFARRKAISKATRNALYASLPQEYIANTIKSLQRERNPAQVQENPGLDKESIIKYLSSKGFNTDILDIITKENRVTIRPFTYLESEEWKAIDNALRILGKSSWIRGGERWEIQ